MSIEILTPYIFKFCGLKEENLKLLNKNLVSVTYKITGDNKIIKITEDMNKFIHAYKYSKIIENNSNHSVNFIDLFMVNKNYGVIIMEYYDQKEIDILYEKSKDLINRQKMAKNLLDIETDLFNIEGVDIDEGLKQFIDDVYMSSLTWSKLDIDIHNLNIEKDNIGKNKEGKYIIFNQKNNNISKECILEQIEGLRDEIGCLNVDLSDINLV